MAHGNLFLRVPASNYNDALPATLNTYDWTEYEPAPNPEDPPIAKTIHPTWAELAAHYAPEYGAAVEVVDTDTFYIIEMLASWLNGDVAKIQALGWTMFEINEARQYIADHQPVVEE